MQFFYQGLSQPNRSKIESMNGGAFLNLAENLAYKALDKLADNSQQWDLLETLRNGASLKGETELI
jgi:hypothetical protein